MFDPQAAGAAALLAAMLFAIGATSAWGIVRVRRARSAVRALLERDGYVVNRIERRVFRQGPLFWTTTRSQIVYRVIVSDTHGRHRAGWARWGRAWLPEPDTLELQWDE
jgi:hypothetical protein